MVVRYLLLLELIAVLLCMWLHTLKNASAAAAAAKLLVAKPGCDPKCGNVIIPYPFGFGSRECYLDEWFEIECRNKSSTADSTGSTRISPRPFLKKPQLEVLEIVLPKLVRVNSPVLSSDCNGSSRRAPVVDLTGSSFQFYVNEISFYAVSVGSNYRAVMENTDQDVARCTTNTTIGNTSCFSVFRGNCCYITIPYDLQVFNVSFESTAGADAPADKCKYAFLAEDEWLRDHISTLSLQDLDYMPVFLEWGIFNTTDEGARLLREQNNKFFSCLEFNSVLNCYCSDGFDGNPYLPDGCQDKNECKLPEHNECPDTCENTRGGYKCRYSRIKLVTIGLGSVLGFLILITSVWWLYKAIRKRMEMKRKKEFFKRNGGLLLEQQLRSSQGNVETTKVFTSKELEVATDHFNKNRILGHGGQGTVYKGILPDGKIVAVKKSKIGNEGKFVEEFINEVVILSQINHRNIVKLLGCCLETEVPLLVYEFIPNGTLFQYLHDQNEEFHVTWEMRLRVATEVAGALSYLHSAASIPIYHRDIKSTNILLDNKFRAKVADFGTSRSVAIDQI